MSFLVVCSGLWRLEVVGVGSVFFYLRRFVGVR